MPVDQNKKKVEFKKNKHQQKRQRTDMSLDTERTKTDKTLSEDRKIAEVKADTTVSLNRAAADTALANSRIETDESIDVDDHIHIERQDTDTALEIERRHMDAALELERKEKRAIQNEFLKAERLETNRSLIDERKHSDMQTQLSAKIIEEEQAAHFETQTALTTRDEFLCIVSHDLRNPLSSIAMAADILKDKLSYPGSNKASIHEAFEFLGIISRNANEALRMIRDLLDVEGFAVGKLNLQIENQEIVSLLQHAIKGIKPLALSKNLSLRLDTKERKIFALCDPDRISQVLSNLLGNAIKFTANGDTISLTAHPDGKMVKISVTDTGPGIPAEAQKIIFKRFSQINKNDRQGLGLGLYIASKIIHAHGGHIWVESKVGQGSAFTFTLPLATMR